MRKVDGQPQTTAQQIGSLIKSARDIMRKDKGLSTDLDRLPLLTWVMFLKFLDDMEQIEESRAAVRGEKYRPAIEHPYRWRDWAAKEDGITGPELLAFISQEEATRPDGKKGAGLLAYLRGLTGGNGSARRRRVIATVFKDVVCRMLSGYLLRDVINKVNGIHFLAKEEVFTLGLLYETMLREMRDAAGENGEFYTPRPVVKFMVEVVNPLLGEVVLDPACGTGGFIVEAYTHLEKQCKTVADRRMLQDKSLRGGEAKPLPYLLCQMNLLLHGLEAPDIDPENSLRFKLTEIGDRDRVDVILTNPPFGGEEEAGIKGNFPADRQTAETALLFLQLIMRKLKRGAHPGRAAVIVPDGTLFDDGVAARIRGELLSEFNLHTVVRLPEGLFAPYAKTIKTNILFFDRTGPTKEVWFFEHRIPDERKSYTKTRPVTLADMEPCLQWWKARTENDQAWRMPVSAIQGPDFNLDRKNPNAFEELTHRPPEVLVGRIDEGLARIGEIVRDVSERSLPALPTDCPLVTMGNFAHLVKRPWVATPGCEVRSLGVKWWGKGAYVAETKMAEELQAARFLVRANDLIYNDMWARHGSVAIVPDDLEGCVASAHFPTWELDTEQVYPPFLTWIFRTPWFWAACEERSRGSTGRNAIRKGLFRGIRIPLPTEIETQKALASALACKAATLAVLTAHYDGLGAEIEALFPSLLDKAFKAALR